MAGAGIVFLGCPSIRLCIRPFIAAITKLVNMYTVIAKKIGANGLQDKGMRSFTFVVRGSKITVKQCQSRSQKFCLVTRLGTHVVSGVLRQIVAF